MPPLARQESQAEIAGLCQRHDRPTAQAAHDGDPVRPPARARAGPAWPDAGTRNDHLTSADRRELSELRRENRRLREDVEILKRVTAIFATAAR